MQSYFEGTTDSSSTYIIGESPEIPVELHELIPYRVSGIYYLTYRADPKKAKPFFNTFYTGDPHNDRREGKIEGGLMGAINRYKTMGRDNSQLVQMGKRRFVYGDQVWSIVLQNS